MVNLVPCQSISRFSPFLLNHLVDVLSPARSRWSCTFFTGRPGANGSGRNAATANAPWNHMEPNILIGHIQYESTVKPYVTCLKPFSL